LWILTIYLFVRSVNVSPSSSQSNVPPAVPAGVGNPLPPESATPAKPKTIGELISGVTENFSKLIRDEVELVKVQASKKAGKIGKGAGMFGAAGVLALYAFGFLLLAGMWGLANVLPIWLSALIVALVLLLIAGILALVGKKSIDKSKEDVIDPASGVKTDVEALKSGLRTANPTPQTTAVGLATKQPYTGTTPGGTAR